ncbi:MAG: hypothetical protein ABSC55_26270 [Syntrophorhabdales bacterium]
MGLETHPLTTGNLCPKGETMLENIYTLSGCSIP